MRAIGLGGSGPLSESEKDSIREVIRMIFEHMTVDENNAIEELTSFIFDEISKSSAAYTRGIVLGGIGLAFGYGKNSVMKRELN